jgi:hypothetical protein
MNNYDWYYDQIKDATLEVIELGEFAKSFRLRKCPDRDTMSTVLIFTPWACIITGDLRVENHGLQALGYGMDWFKQRHEPSYLAEKFLDTRWVPEKARAYFREIQNNWKAKRADYLASTLDEVQEPEWDEIELQKNNWLVCGDVLENVTIIEALEAFLSDENQDYFASAGELFTALPAYQDRSQWNHQVKAPRWRCPFDTSDGIGGYGYPDHLVGWLSAINRRFAELYSSMDLSK